MILKNLILLGAGLAGAFVLFLVGIGLWRLGIKKGLKLRFGKEGLSLPLRFPLTAGEHWSKNSRSISGGIMKPKALELADEEGRHPTWEMALLYPDQGGWTEADYLRLDIGRHVDYSSGYLEFQPMPDEKHQAILFFLVQALKTYAGREGGKATMAPFPMRLWEEKYREPDALFMKRENLDRCGPRSWGPADLVIEVVSESNRNQDLSTKREEYAQAGIPEYWLVHPERGVITVLTLKDGAYVVHGEFQRGQKAVSKGLAGFEVDVSSALDAR